jgi:hypothetical protein
MKLSRRTALSILGLAGPAAGLAVEHAIADDALAIRGASMGGVNSGNDYDGRKFSAALRRLADEIDSRGIDPQKLHVSAELNRDQIVVQRLTLDFLINDAAA